MRRVWCLSTVFSTGISPERGKRQAGTACVPGRAARASRCVNRSEPNPGMASSVPGRLKARASLNERRNRAVIPGDESYDASMVSSPPCHGRLCAGPPRLSLVSAAEPWMAGLIPGSSPGTAMTVGVVSGSSTPIISAPGITTSRARAAQLGSVELSLAGNQKYPLGG